MESNTAASIPSSNTTDTGTPHVDNDFNSTETLIIGGGISGITTAINLIRNNKTRNFVILEKSSQFGGTWRDQQYPGCCCDVWSHLYSLSFEPNPDWTHLYPGQEEILAYWVKVAQKYGLYEHVRFNTEVEEARWDAATHKWLTKVKLTGGKDAEFYVDGYTLSSDFLVSGVGQLNLPKMPDIPGLDSFKGKKMHSARWDRSYNLRGKKIAIIGNGATAAQIIPEIAKVAEHVTVFQRQPNWVIDRGDAPISDLKRSMYRYLPFARTRLRAGMMDFREDFYQAIAADDTPLAKMLKDMHHAKVEKDISDPELRKKLTPIYPVGCKRVLISDDYFPALNRDNVTLVTDSIKEINEGGVATHTQTYDADLLVCATGFRTVEFMHPIQIYGTNGRSINDVWKDGAQAYLGMTIESMPNFCMLYGPNTNLGHNSIILMIEAQARYIAALADAVHRARATGSPINVQPDPARLAAFNEEVQRVLKTMAFNSPNCTSWYKNDKGLITNNWSGTVIEYQERCSAIDWNDYEIAGPGREAFERERGRGKTQIGRVIEETQVSDAVLAVLGAVASAAVVLGGVAWRNPRLLRTITGSA